MCEIATSHLFKVKEREMLLHTIGSHSQTREALGLNGKDPNIIEVEWREGDSLPSILFNGQDSDEEQLIKDWYSKRFVSRLDMVRYCIAHSRSQHLDLRGLTSLPDNVQFPATCQYLYLGSLKAVLRNRLKKVRNQRKENQ